MRLLKLLFAFLLFSFLGLEVSAQCAQGEVEAELTIFTQQFATEICWDIKDQNGVVIANTIPFDYPTDNTTYDPNFLPQHKVCLDVNGPYDFSTYDSFGDGWNGSTYEWRKACDNNLIINNGGISPQDNISICFGAGPFHETTENFIPGVCTLRDLTVSAIIPPNESCEGDFYIHLEVKNLGAAAADSFTVYAAIYGDTQSSYITTPIPAYDKANFTVGPFALNGSPLGTSYPTMTWTDLFLDEVPSNDSLPGNNPVIYKSTPKRQMRKYLPNIETSPDGSIETFIPFCDSTITMMDNCFRIKSLELNTIFSGNTNGLDFTLVSPSGTSLILSDSIVGTSAVVYNVVLSDTAQNSITSLTNGFAPGSYKPQEQIGFAKFHGEDPNGLWTLKIQQNDTSAYSTTSFQRWTLAFEKGQDLDLGPDVNVCGSNSYAIISYLPNANYNWSTGASSQNINVHSTEIYSLTTTDIFGCENTESILVNFQDTVVEGHLNSAQNIPMGNTKVYFIEHDATNNTIAPFDSTTTNGTGNFVRSISKTPFWIKAVPDPVNYPTHLPTYFGDAVLFNDADALVGTENCDTLYANIQIIEEINPGGNGMIDGFLVDCDSTQITTGNPIPNQMILLINAMGNPAGHATTDQNGHFLFDNLVHDTYRFWVDIPSVNNVIAPTLSVNQTTTIWDSIGLCFFPTHLNLESANSIGDTLDTTLTSATTKEFFNAVKVYPNPTKGVLTIDYQGTGFSFDRVRILNKLGQTIFEQKLNSGDLYRMDTTGLAKGIYHLTIEGTSGILQRSIVVN